LSKIERKKKVGIERNRGKEKLKKDRKKRKKKGKIEDQR